MKRAFFGFFMALQLLSLNLQADTVVGIHGFLTNWKSLKPIQHTLETCQFDICLWNYDSRKGFIEEHACKLFNTLQEIAALHPGEPIHFVCHSVGAVVLRAALNIPSCPREAKMGRAVLLAPPNQGSCLGRQYRNCPTLRAIMGNKSGWQLLNYGPCDMKVFGEFPATMQVLVIAGTKGSGLFFDQANDGYLTVNETRLNTPHYFTHYPITHGDLMTYPPVLCCIKRFLCPECTEAH